MQPHSPINSTRPSRRRFLKNLGLAAATASGIGFWPGGLSNLQVLGQDQGQTPQRFATGTNGVVATVHPLASRAAIAAFERGGNAIDAAISASLMLAVVDGHNSGIGGGCLALVRRSSGAIFAVDGREMAPAAATPDMFIRDGKPQPLLSQLGPLAAGVPGLVAALHQLNESAGKIGWIGGLADAAKVARDGFAIDSNYANNLRNSASEIRKYPEAARILLDSDGNPLRQGMQLKQLDLAATLDNLAEHGPKWFYEGAFAEKIADFMQQTGGILTAADMANYHAVLRQPIESRYRGHRILGFPPPSSGGLHIAQMLGMLELHNVRAIFEQDIGKGLHLLLEVMKRAMADRAYWLGDADHVVVPRGLLDREYLALRASDIDLERATQVLQHGQPPRATEDVFGKKHTTHLTTADRDGNVVALTQTVNTSFGCKMIVPGTGVILNNEMDDFAIAPGVRNAFGLVGAEANAVAPGKRPLSSMSPTLVLGDDGRPILSCGAAGGPKIITTTLQVLVRSIDLNQSLAEAIAAPRVHHQWSPDQAVCEESLNSEVVRQLEQKGHSVQRIRAAAIAQAVRFQDDGIIQAASDTRVPSAAFSC